MSSIESHICVIITCDCGKTFESEEYDYDLRESAEETTVNRAQSEGWKIKNIVEGPNMRTTYTCPICNGDK